MGSGVWRHIPLRCRWRTRRRWFATRSNTSVGSRSAARTFRAVAFFLKMAFMSSAVSFAHLRRWRWAATVACGGQESLSYHRRVDLLNNVRGRAGNGFIAAGSRSKASVDEVVEARFPRLRPDTTPLAGDGGLTRSCFGPRDLRCSILGVFGGAAPASS